MDIKKMFIEMAESQADQMKDDMMSKLASDEMSEKIASAINKKIDIPFVSEEKEQIFFEKVVDVVTDILAGMFKGKD
jgi:non-homologous end joining protein Ku